MMLTKQYANTLHTVASTWLGADHGAICWLNQWVVGGMGSGDLIIDVLLHLII